MADTHYCTGCGERMDISVWPTATFHEGCPNDGMWKPLEELQEARSAAQDRYQLAREAISHAEELHQRGNLSGAIREYQRAATLRTTGSSSHTVRLDGDPVPFAQFLPFAFHRGGCGKWDADNVFHVENDCTCGLARLFGGDPCPCSSCEHHRG